MTSNRFRVVRFRTATGVLLLAASFLVPAAVAADSGAASTNRFPRTVAYQGEAVDAAGLPLDGLHSLTFTYFDHRGEELFQESMDGVAVVAGRFEVELGTGRAVSDGRYASLAGTLAEHPEISFELTVDDAIFEPRVGILPAGHSLKSRLVAAGLRSESDDEEHWKHYSAPGGATATQSGILAPAGSRAGSATDTRDTQRTRPYTLPVRGPMLSAPMRDLPITVRTKVQDDLEVNPPRHESLFDAGGNRFGTVAPKVDDVLADAAPVGKTPSISVQWEGIDNVNGVLPPDTEGTVGPNHYVQVVNLSFAVYDKSGTLLAGPSNNNTLWAGFGGPCQTDNSGDAIFLYDEQADRYVLTQFAVAGSHQSVCWAVSQTPDPTGSYYLYEVVTPRFPDYYKVGVWPDSSNNAYFFGTNSGFQGQYDVFAVDRANMLAGAAARPMQFFQNFVNLMMPADLDGPVPPTGSPGIFYTFRDGGESYFSNPPTDSIDVWEFDVDWNTSANSTFNLADSITPAQGLADFNWTVCGFFVSNCIPQPGTGQGIDSASWWPMQRLVYRNFGSHETLVGSWTVDVLSAGNRAAPRWFELRDFGSGWTMYQQGTHSPDAIHRWMPSVAMDGSGNIAIGYSRGDGSNFPSIYYATRESTDPLGTLQAEALMFAGTGSQTHSAARWGDYSSMELDPADDCTFWYTTEYLATTGSAPWRTRVGSFVIPGCGSPPVPDFTVSCTPASHSIQQGDNAASTCTVTSLNGFAGTVDLSCAGNPSGINCGFAPVSVTPPVDGSTDSTLTISVDLSQATGDFNFDVEGVNGATTKTSAMSVTVTPEGSNGPQEAVFNATLQVPDCSIPGSSCDSLALLDGRWNLGPESNQPNTIFDSCADGTSGNYHSDESIDHILVSTLDSGNFTEGDTVQIDVTVWAWSTGSQDTLDLYYAADANSPSWVYITSIVPPGGGAQVLSTQYTLPAGALQAVRGNFRYQGSVSSCSTGNWDDHDDLAFAVETSGPECVIDNDCDNGLFCDGAEVCNAGVCEAGTPPVCDDGVSCTVDSCNEGTDSCDFTPNSGLCDNGMFCDGAETCDPVLDCQPGTPPVCDDGVSCTIDACNEGTDTCDNTPDNGVCDNGLFCDGGEFCDPALDCQPGTPPDCDDGVSCTVDSCNEGSDTCDNTPNDGLCDNGEFCDGSETCDPALDCQAGADPCPGQSCDEGTNQCVACIVDADCSNGLFCDGAEVCNAGVCEVGTPVVCDDGVGCTVDSCNEGSDSCDFLPDDSLCDNGLFCDGSETCDPALDCQPGTDPCAPLMCDETGDFCFGGSDPTIWMSFRSNTAVPGVGTVSDEDIVSYDEFTGSWALEFDGSDVGLSSLEISGLAILPSGDLLLSFTAAGTVGGLSVDDSDIVQFTPTSLGSDTAGTFSIYFDGSDVGMTTNGEDVDAIALHPDGRLIVSTTGTVNANGITNRRDEDLILFTGTLGASTSGSFEQYFDGSDVGLNNSGGEDMDAAGLTTAGTLLFSTLGNFSVSGLSGADEDVVEFSGTFGTSTSGVFSMRQDLSTLGIASGEDIGSMEIVE